MSFEDDLARRLRSAAAAVHVDERPQLDQARHTVLRRERRRRYGALCIVVAGASITLAVSTLPQTPGGSGEASCAFEAHFEGHTYRSLSLEIEVVPGEELGEARLPGCDDTGGSEPRAPDELIRVAELPGVDPDIALVWLDSLDRLLVRGEALQNDPDQLPPEITRLLHAPRCEADDAPLELTGPWLGILGADGETELDLLPPYDVFMSVEEASTPRYMRAHLTIRVPASLGRPLTREDIRSSLWEGGAIAVVVECKGDRFLARSVEAFPPV